MKLELSTLAALALAAAASAPAAPPAQGEIVSARRVADMQEIGGSAGDACVDSIEVAPVLQMTRAGSTLLGPSMDSLMVYSNGLVIMCMQSPAGGGSSAQMFQVDPARISSLRFALEELEASRQCDARVQAYDLPLTTVTVFTGDADAKAHSYSYWIAEGGQRAVEDEIMSFVHDIALREQARRK